MKMYKRMGIALAVFAMAGTSGAQEYGGYRGEYQRNRFGGEFECASVRNDYRECAVPGRGYAVITRQISQKACVEGRTWGQRDGTVWVQKGCRARFSVTRGFGNERRQRWRNEGNRWGNGVQTRSFLCESVEGRQSYCDARTRGDVRFRRQVSRSPCIEGRTWGIDGRGVWVADGCRAEFEVREY